MSVLAVWTQGAYPAVRTRHLDVASNSPPLSVLMQWAEGGSLDDFIDVRLGRASSQQFPHLNSHATSATAEGTSSPAQPSEPFSRSARIRAFRALQHASPEERERLKREAVSAESKTSDKNATNWKAVHLLSAEEVRSLFRDVVEGLAFLVGNSKFHGFVPLTFPSLARQVYPSPRSETWQCIADVG